MRNYTVDSPEAAARVVAMTLMADGGPDQAEFDVLRQHDAAGQLGLPAHRLYDVLRDFCEDVLMRSEHSWSHACHFDEHAIASILDEIRDRHLRQTLLRLCTAVAEADGRIERGELAVLDAATERWQLETWRPVPAPAHRVATLP